VRLCGPARQQRLRNREYATGLLSAATVALCWLASIRLPAALARYALNQPRPAIFSLESDIPGSRLACRPNMIDLFSATAQRAGTCLMGNLWIDPSEHPNLGILAG